MLGYSSGFDYVPSLHDSQTVLIACFVLIPYNIPPVFVDRSNKMSMLATFLFATGTIPVLVDTNVAFTVRPVIGSSADDCIW